MYAIAYQFSILQNSYFVRLLNFKDGKKEVLGLWLADTEGAKFWAGVLTEIKNRGTEDILIACMDGLTGFPDAVRAVFPDTHIQHCIVHMVRSSTKFVSYKDLKAVCKDLKEVYFSHYSWCWTWCIGNIREEVAGISWTSKIAPSNLTVEFA